MQMVFLMTYMIGYAENELRLRPIYKVVSCDGDCVVALDAMTRE